MAWGAKEPWPAIIHDLSPEGLRLGLGRRFERGTGLAIELPGEDGPSTVLARVVRVEPRPGGGWLLGCVFISRLSDEEVGRLLGLDRRGRSGPLVPVPLAPATADGSVTSVLFQARLAGGDILRWYVKHLERSLTWPLQRGQLIEVRLGDAPVELEVHHCQLRPDCWVVNCHFTSPPSPEVLRALGKARA
jgi:hypothetical protein